MNYWSRSTFQGITDSCNRRHAQIRVDFHDTIVAYLRSIHQDPQFCVKIVSSLPKQVTERYYEERNSTGYEIPLDQAHLSRVTKALGAQHMSQMVLGQVDKPNTQQPHQSTEGQDVNRFELLGRPLQSLTLVRINYADGYKEDVPKALFLLTTFFLVHPEHLERQGLFRVNGDRSKIEELSIHMQLGDFSILSKFKD